MIFCLPFGELINKDHTFISKEKIPKYIHDMAYLLNNKVSESNKLDSKKILEYITNYFDTTDWKWIKTHHIPYGLNNQEQVNYSYKKEIMAQKEKTYLAGDWNLYGSTNAAIHSGKCAAEAIIRRVNTNI